MGGHWGGSDVWRGCRAPWCCQTVTPRCISQSSPRAVATVVQKSCCCCAFAAARRRVEAELTRAAPASVGGGGGESLTADAVEALTDQLLEKVRGSTERANAAAACSPDSMRLLHGALRVHTPLCKAQQQKKHIMPLRPHARALRRVNSCTCCDNTKGAPLSCWPLPFHLRSGVRAPFPLAHVTD